MHRLAVRVSASQGVGHRPSVFRKHALAGLRPGANLPCVFHMPLVYSLLKQA